MDSTQSEPSSVSRRRQLWIKVRAASPIQPLPGSSGPGLLTRSCHQKVCRADTTGSAVSALPASGIPDSRPPGADDPSLVVPTLRASDRADQRQQCCSNEVFNRARSFQNRRPRVVTTETWILIKLICRHQRAELAARLSVSNPLANSKGKPPEPGRNSLNDSPSPVKWPAVNGAAKNHIQRNNQPRNPLARQSSTGRCSKHPWTSAHQLPVFRQLA